MPNEQQQSAQSIEQEPISEAPQPEAKPKEDLLSPKFADLARKEKALRERFKARDADLKAKEEAIKARESEFQKMESWKSRLSQDPISVLNELGISYDQIVNSQLNQPSPQELEIKALKEEIQALKDGTEQTRKYFEEQQTNQYQQAVNQIKNDVKMLVDGNDEFSTIADTNSHDAVVALIEETFQKEGRLMSNEEAAREVENYLVEEAYKMSQLKKVQNRLAQKLAQKEPTKQKQPEQQSLKTLTNAVAQSSSRPRMSEAERKARAIAAFHGQLKE